MHYRSLFHNQAPLKKWGIRKPIIASLSSRDFPDKESWAWLDRSNSREVAVTRDSFRRFSPGVQDNLQNWSDNGYMILENFLDPRICDGINEEIDNLLRIKKVSFTNGNKLMFASRKSDLIYSVTQNRELLDILRFILDREVVLFQTINFIQGSGQRAHSDSIHMTTYPLGYLIAGWLALENVSPENGPLFYYPGSHRLPYLLNSEFNEGGTSFRLGRKDYSAYEDAIEELVLSRGFARKEFFAKKGDLLIWHANLVHGGAPILDPRLTRKSMVMHYFARDVIKYHEITERPSLLSNP
jgi:ectoine hydroxylase-related dioxygenase (phytanoyl-CoA dioxygenase family)